MNNHDSKTPWRMQIIGDLRLENPQIIKAADQRNYEVPPGKHTIVGAISTDGKNRLMNLAVVYKNSNKGLLPKQLPVHELKRLEARGLARIEKSQAATISNALKANDTKNILEKPQAKSLKR